MCKTFWILLMAVLVWGFAPMPLLAGQEADTAAIESAWELESPLSQTDIDNYLGLWPQIMDMAQQEFSRKNLREIFRQANWSEAYGSYVLVKMNMALILLEAPELEAKLALSQPENALPTETEMKLVQKNLNRILRIQNAYIERQLSQP